ncbi:MAG: baseplate J/gp47 family protein [Marivibrio sp.]|uniref:baseplate J/gp47 family protein n=1 Tax=Marivibrio sp. TaxID=2039719 RepID=UPI0032EDEF42
MPFERPTLTQLIEQTQNDVDGRLPGAAARLRRSVLGVLARVWAGGLHGLYGFLAWIVRQWFPDTAEAENLDRWAGSFGLARKAAWKASGAVTFTGEDGAAIPLGAILQRPDGVRYRTTAAAAIAGGTASAAVTAEKGGAAGNADAGLKLALTSPIVGVQGEATIAAGGLTQGSDVESDDRLRERVLLEMRAPAHGGRRLDYIRWALRKEDHGIEVTRVWVNPHEMGFGTLTVRIMMDDAYADGIPQPADLTAVAAYIDEVRPVTVKELYVVAPIAAPIAFEISGLNPNTAAVKAAIETALKDLIRRESEPGGTILVSHIREAISLAAGETDHALVAPAADVVAGAGEIPTFGSVTWS